MGTLAPRRRGVNQARRWRRRRRKRERRRNKRRRRKRSSILGWLEVPVNESLWFHAMEIGHALGALKTPAHGMGGSVIGEGFSTMQHCGRESTVTNTDTQTHTPTQIDKIKE